MKNYIFPLINIGLLLLILFLLKFCNTPCNQVIKTGLIRTDTVFTTISGAGNMVEKIKPLSINRSKYQRSNKQDQRTKNQDSLLTNYLEKPFNLCDSLEIIYQDTLKTEKFSVVIRDSINTTDYQLNRKMLSYHYIQTEITNTRIDTVFKNLPVKKKYFSVGPFGGVDYMGRPTVGIGVQFKLFGF